jgi:glutamate:GABA antiporter
MHPTGAPAAPSEKAGLRRELGFRDLVLFSMVGVIGTRWIAAAARSGPSAVTIWILGTIFFFVPQAFAIARLSARYPETGGLYVWTRECFGEWHAFLCFWVYWLGLTFWFPSALMSYTSMTAYAFGPKFEHFADNRTYVLAASLGALVLVTGANVLGLRFGKWIDNVGGVSAYVMAAVVATLGLAVFLKRGSATHFEWISTPNWDRINFWSQMAFALTGLELAPILGGEIRNPERTLPRSALIVAPMAGLFYAITTAGVLAILPSDSVNPMHGLAQSVSVAGHQFGLPRAPQFVAILIALGALGQFSVLGASAARLPYAVGMDRFLPAALARVHPRWGTPYVSILLFGGLSGLFLILAQLGDTMRSAYQTVTDMMVIAGLGPFGYIFAAAWKEGARWSSIFGFGMTALALICSVVPTSEVSNVWVFEAKLWGGAAVLVLSARFLYLRARR